MSRIYIAAPLFDEMELRRNEEIAALLQSFGHEVYLPQEDSGEAIKGAPREKLFEDDVKGIYWCDTVLALLDGRVPDEGTAFEMGMAFALDKKLVAYTTDSRSFMEGHMNVMLECSPCAILRSRAELTKYFI